MPVMLGCSQASSQGLPATYTNRARLSALATVTAVLAYLQIVLGAVLRHVPVDAQPATFHAGREVPPVPGRQC